MKAKIGFKAFYNFGLVLVRFLCICEMAFNQLVSSSSTK